MDIGIQQALRVEPSSALVAFVEQVGGPNDAAVSVAGGRIHWHLGGELDAGVRTISAPVGIVQFEPAEMIVRCGAGTTYAELRAALATRGQMCPLDPTDHEATVGGLLAAGLSGYRRARYGAARDLLLEAQFVTANGELLRAGAPVVKNVSGFDICRLLVGSFGTLGLIGEVVLRCRPAPARGEWFKFTGQAPSDLPRSVIMSSMLWDGLCTYVLLEGHHADIRAEAPKFLAAGAVSVHNGPELPSVGRISADPARLETLAIEWFTKGEWVAEVGVGTVHTSWSPQRRPSPHRLERELKRTYDPTRRLSPGRLEL